MSGSPGAMTARAEVRGVLLDVGGVLLVPDPVTVSEVTGRHGGHGTTDRVIRAHYAAMAAADDGVRFTWPVYYRRLAAGCAVPAGSLDAAALALRAAYTATNVWRTSLPGVRAALTRLAELGYRIAIVSNSDGTVEKALAAATVCQVGPGPGVEVDLVLDSHLVGAAKPDPAIFTLALEGLGLGPEQVVHIGDTRFADVAGARAAGIRPLHVDPYGDCGQPAGHEHVRSLADAVDRALTR
jgi:putative hydrolase of the HAD superfamily